MQDNPQPILHNERKMSKYLNAKKGPPKADVMNKTDEFNKMRRINSSMTNLSVNHKSNLSKSKKKKKPTHMKSQSNIPVYSKHISERTSEKKQYSDSKHKKKKSITKHTHHKSETNVSSGVTNNYIDFKTYINLNPSSPDGSKAILIPSTKILANSHMVKGGIGGAPQVHKRTQSDMIPYNFNHNEIFYTGSTTLDERTQKLSLKYKPNFPTRKTHDKREVMNSPKNVQYMSSKGNYFYFDEL